MNENPYSKPYDASEDDGVTRIHRREDGSIDIDYYKGNACLLRSRYVYELLGLFIRCWSGRSRLPGSGRAD